MSDKHLAGEKPRLGEEADEIWWPSFFPPSLENGLTILGSSAGPY